MLISLIHSSLRLIIAAQNDEHEKAIFRRAGHQH